jgi:hypothetical protein
MPLKSAMEGPNIVRRGLTQLISRTSEQKDDGATTKEKRAVDFTHLIGWTRLVEMQRSFQWFDLVSLDI